MARRWRRWAFESAALDLALAQAKLGLPEALGREPAPVRFVNSLGLGDPPAVAAVGRRLVRYPGLRFKLDARRRGPRRWRPMSPRPAWSAERIERLMAAFARDCPGYHDAIVLLDSTPVECGRSVETARRSELGVARAHHYSRRHSRWFWGCRARTLHGLRRPDRLQAAGRQRRHLAQLALRPTDTGLR